MALTQLNPSIPLRVDDLGGGEAIAVIDYGPEHDLLWVIVLDESGRIVAAPNAKVSGFPNWSLGRNTAKVPVEEKLKPKDEPLPARYLWRGWEVGEKLFEKLSSGFFELTTRDGRGVPAGPDA